MTIVLFTCTHVCMKWNQFMCMGLSVHLQVIIEYIDYGTEEEHEPSRLRRARTDNPLHKLPPQAVKCKIHDLPTQQVINSY